MAYLDRTADPRRRTTAITGVIAIHALIVYVLLTGLAGVGFKPVHTWKPIIDFPVPQPTLTPEPSQSAKPDPHEDVVAIPKPPFPTSNDNHVDVTPYPDEVDDTVTRVPIPHATPVPLPSPIFTPRAPALKSDPKRWVTTDDYPSRDLREGNEGVTVFRAVVGTNGRVSACEIVRSSGHPGLDAATCKAVSARARFEPATDENGEKVVGTYGNSVRWQIPR